MIKAKALSFMDKNKETKTQEEYTDRFLTKVKRTIRIDEENEENYKNLTEILYKLPEEDYKLWLKVFNKVDIQFINNYVKHVVFFASNNSTKSLEEAYELYKKKQSVLMRSMPTVNTTTVNENKEELLELYDKIVWTVSNHVDGSLALKVQEEVITQCDEENIDPLVKDFYDELINEINKDVLKLAKNNLSKISACAQHIEEINNIQYVKDRNTRDYKKKNLGKLPAYSAFDK